MNTTERTEIWREYFDKLLYTEESKEFIEIRDSEINEYEVEELIQEDVKKGNEKLKNNKVA